jgi:anti-sigma28 factor (negative regulator of flagellin synthesis)
MRVNDISTVVHGLDPRDAAKSALKPGKSPDVDKKSVDGDALDLSASAQLTANSSMTLEAASVTDSDLTPEQVAELRAKIASGHYNKPASLDALAQKISDFYAR